MTDPRKTATTDRPATEAAAVERPRRTRTVFSLSEEETFDLGRSMAQALKGGELILLVGELGLGKTVFARGIAAGLGVPPEDVNSPSFTLIQEYPESRLPLYHIDLYRLGDADDFETLGLEEIMASGAVVVVEWGDKLPEAYRASAMTVRFHDVGEDSRRIEWQEP